MAGWNYGLFINETLATPRTDWRRQWVYRMHHGMLYFACSFCGFVARALAASLTQSLTASVNAWSSLSAGSATVFLALCAGSVLGVSGALSRLLYLGQRVWQA